MKRGPKLNLLKKLGKGGGVGGGGGNPTTLTVSSLESDFDKEAKSDKMEKKMGKVEHVVQSTFQNMLITF